MFSSINIFVAFIALIFTNNAALTKDKVQYDLSMIVNMLNHHDVKIQKLEKGLSSVIDEIRKMNQIMKDGLKKMDEKITSVKEDTAFVDISIESQAAADPGIPKGTWGLSTIFVNGVDRSWHRRGHNVVVVDIKRGKIEASTAFDTWGGGAKASSDLKQFIDKLQNGKIVLVAVQDEGTNALFDDAKAALESIGAGKPDIMGHYGSFALLGYKGKTKRKWVWQVTNTKGKGPSKLKARVPISED